MRRLSAAEVIFGAAQERSVGRGPQRSTGQSYHCAPRLPSCYARAFGAVMSEVRDRHDGKKSPPRSGTGREELRSTWFRPYLLRLRAERGEAALRALLSTAGIPVGL